MTPEALGKWLSDNVDSIYSFMDYEPTLETEAELAETLGQWLGNKRWAKGGDRFVHLGIDGAGSQFAAWIRPNSTQIPVVFLAPKAAQASWPPAAKIGQKPSRTRRASRNTRSLGKLD